MASIMTLSFSSTLLTAYFNVKCKPMVNTLDDSMVNNQAHIVTDINYINVLIETPNFSNYHKIFKIYHLQIDVEKFLSFINLLIFLKTILNVTKYFHIN